jgi:hypothetical protein
VKVTIRPSDPRDADDLADVFFRSVRQAALSDYTAAARYQRRLEAYAADTGLLVR